MSSSRPLSVREKMALRLADRPYRYQGAREADARELLGYSPVKFYSVVGRLLEDPATEAWDAMLVRRLRRIRDARRLQRTASYRLGEGFS